MESFIKLRQQGRTLLQRIMGSSSLIKPVSSPGDRLASNTFSTAAMLAPGETVISKDLIKTLQQLRRMPAEKRLLSSEYVEIGTPIYLIKSTKDGLTEYLPAPNIEAADLVVMHPDDIKKFPKKEV